MAMVVIMAMTVRAVGVGVMFAINVGIAAEPLEHLGAQQTGDQRADQRQEDDGS